MITENYMKSKWDCICFINCLDDSLLDIMFYISFHYCNYYCNCWTSHSTRNHLWSTNSKFNWISRVIYNTSVYRFLLWLLLEFNMQKSFDGNHRFILHQKSFQMVHFKPLHSVHAAHSQKLKHIFLCKMNNVSI